MTASADLPLAPLSNRLVRASRRGTVQIIRLGHLLVFFFRALAGVPGVLGLFDRPELGAAELAAALESFCRPGVVLIDDAELLRDCGAAEELSRLITLGRDAGRALVLGGDADKIGVGFNGWQVDAKRARRGCLTAPSTIPDGDLIGVRLSRDVIGQPPRLGRCLLHTGDGKLITVSVPAV